MFRRSVQLQHLKSLFPTKPQQAIHCGVQMERYQEGMPNLIQTSTPVQLVVEKEMLHIFVQTVLMKVYTKAIVLIQYTMKMVIGNHILYAHVALNGSARRLASAIAMEKIRWKSS